MDYKCIFMEKFNNNNLTGSTALVSGGALFVIGQNNNITCNNFTTSKARNGAAITNSGTKTSIIENIIKYGNATSVGGAISNWNARDTIITNNIIHHNQAQHATVYIRGTNITVQSNNIYSNKVNGSGGAIFNIGINNIINRNTLRSNNAGNFGGAIYTCATNTIITGNTITRNSAGHGGAIIDTRHNTTTMNNNNITNNST